MAKRQRNASEATQLAVPTVATAAMAGVATHLLTHRREATGFAIGLGALIGLGLAIYHRR